MTLLVRNKLVPYCITCAQQDLAHLLVCFEDAQELHGGVGQGALILRLVGEQVHLAPGSRAPLPYSKVPLMNGASSASSDCPVDPDNPFIRSCEKA